MSRGMVLVVVLVFGTAVVGVGLGALWIWLDGLATRRRRERVESFTRRGWK